MKWILVLLLAALCPQVARAYHTEEQRSLEESAYLLRHGEWELGPFELGVGLGPLQLSTRVAPWILGAALRKFTPNVGLDGTLVDRRGVTLSAGIGLYYMNSNKLIDDSTLIRLFIIPMSTSLSWRINQAHTASLMFKYVRNSTDADAEEDDLVVKGAALADNFQVSGSWEWRFNRVTALLCAFRYLPYQGDPIFHSEGELDDRTDVTVEGQVDTEDMQHSVAGSINGNFSWKYFNLRVGMAYGALFMSGTGLALPVKYPYPELNLYWRI